MPRLIKYAIKQFSILYASPIFTYEQDMDKGLLLHHEVVYTSQLTAVSKSPHHYPENWTSCYLQYVTFIFIVKYKSALVKSEFAKKFLFRKILIYRNQYFEAHI